METRRLILAWLALMMLLASTVTLALLPIGPLKPGAAFAIALAKASIIYWVFMEVRSESVLVRLAIGTSLVWVALLAFVPFIPLL
jgi:cytochrome c oxidase subunit 4